MSASALDQVFATAELRLEVCTHLPRTSQLLKLRTINTKLRDAVDFCPHLQRRLLKGKQDAFLEPVIDYQAHSVGVGEPTYNELYGSHQRCIPVVDLNSLLHSQWLKWHDVLQHEVWIWLSIHDIHQWNDRMLRTFFVQPPLDFAFVKLVKTESDEEVVAASVAGNTLQVLRDAVVQLLQTDAVLCEQDDSADSVSNMHVVAGLSGCTISCFGGFVPPSDQVCQGAHEHYESDLTQLERIMRGGC
jgi:hypothetical protein